MQCKIYQLLYNFPYCLSDECSLLTQLIYAAAMAERHEAMKVIDRFSSIRSVSEECSLLLEEAANNLRAIK